MKEAITMGIGVLFIMVSFTPFVLDIVYPPEEYCEPISFVGVTDNIIQKMLVVETCYFNTEENMYRIFVDRGNVTDPGIVTEIYVNNIDIMDNIIRHGALELRLDSTKPIVLAFRAFGKWIRKEISPVWHSIFLNAEDIEPQYQVAGSIILHLDTKLENGFLFFTSPSNIVIVENRFVINPENENAVIALNLQKRENMFSGYITLAQANLYTLHIEGTISNMKLLLEPENKIFVIDMSFKLDNEYADNLHIESIGVSAWLENVKFVQLRKKDKIFCTITDIGNISLNGDCGKYDVWATSHIIVQPMTITAVLSVTGVSPWTKRSLWDYLWWWITAKTMYFCLFVMGCFMITTGYIVEKQERRMIKWR